VIKLLYKPVRIALRMPCQMCPRLSAGVGFLIGLFYFVLFIVQYYHKVLLHTSLKQIYTAFFKIRINDINCLFKIANQ
jgi:hypothetical protein